MPDREKVIKDIEECLSASCRGYRPRLSCPYNDDEWDIMRDALAILKEQEAVKPKKADNPEESEYCCGICGYPLWLDEFYCAHCGRRIEWEGR